MKIMENRNLMVLVLIAALLTGTLLGVTLAYQFDIYRPESEEQETPPSPDPPTYENITVKESHSLIQNNTNNSNFTILDVRTPGEFADGRIPGAVNIDYYNESFGDMLGILDRNRTFLIHCRSGARSGFALELMKELEFREVYNMLGGIIEWKEEGFATVEE